MNVENSKEADPVRAAAAVGPARAAQIDVALILSCIRASRSKRRMRQSARGKVIVHFRSSCRSRLTVGRHAFRANASPCRRRLKMASAYPIPEDQGSVVSVWAGEDPAFHATLLEQLESAGIRYSDKVLGDDEVAPTADPLPIDWKPRFGFEVAVLSADLAAARAILETLLNEEPADLEIPAQDEAPSEPPLDRKSTRLNSSHSQISYAVFCLKKKKKKTKKKKHNKKKKTIN